MDAQAQSCDSSTPGRLEHILLVEDDPVVLAAVRRRLAFDGYRVDTARCGSEALQWLAGNSPDLVILAVTGSRHEEAQVEMRIRLGCTAPVLLLTAFRTVAREVVAPPAEGSEWLVKPFAIDELLTQIRSLLLRMRMPRGTCARTDSGTWEGG